MLGEVKCKVGRNIYGCALGLLLCLFEGCALGKVLGNVEGCTLGEAESGVEGKVEGCGATILTRTDQNLPARQGARQH